MQAEIKEIIASMTLLQKAQVLVGTGMHPDMHEIILAFFGKPDTSDPDYAGMIKRIQAYLPGAAGFTAEFPELGISCQVLADGPAGLRISPERENDERRYYCTAFPIATLLASTWDTELVREVGRAIGNEVLEYNADILLGPGLNIQRDPLCGRNFEYYSEDPLLTGKMAAAMVSGIQANGVGASPKHFAANNQETNRLTVNALLSERALREIYLKGFEITVREAAPWTIMTSYNRINGSYTSESRDLLSTILRDEWGFEGYVMTDWGGGADVIAQLKAGNDLLMPGSGEQVKRIVNAVEDGAVEEALVDRNLEHMFGVMLRTPRQNGFKPGSQPDLPAHAELTRQAAADGMVLLENRDGTLPLGPEIMKLAVFGTSSYEFISGGTGSGDVNEAYTVSLIEGLGLGGYVIDRDLAAYYRSYIKKKQNEGLEHTNELSALMGGTAPIPEMVPDRAELEKAANGNDIALLTIGRNAGEGGDREAVAGDFYLDTQELELISTVSRAFHAKGKKLVIILNTGGLIETASWSSLADALLCAWQPGQEAGNALRDILSGRVNPSGRLAVSWPRSYDDTPTSGHFPGKAPEGSENNDTPELNQFSFMQRRPWEALYYEDIYVGYRYYATFAVPVAYPFGYGLSYTSFSLKLIDLKKSEVQGEWLLDLELENTGRRPGREVVQVYLDAPEGKLEKPSGVLVAFTKSSMLQPGEKEQLKLIIQEKNLASYDPDQSAWVLEAGRYTMSAGFSSRNYSGSLGFDLASEKIIESCHRALAPEMQFTFLSKNKLNK